MAIALVLIALVVGAGTAAAQDAPVTSNGTEYSDSYEQCIADAKTGDEPGTGFDRSANKALRALGADGVANLTNMANCAGDAISVDPGGAVSTAAGNAASAFWGDPIGDFVKSLLEGNAQALALIMTMWIKESPFSGADFASSVEGVFNLTLWAQALLLVVSLIVAGTRMAVARNRGLGDGFEDIGQVMFNFILAGAALPAVILSLHMATDAISTQWLEEGLGGDPAASINAVAMIDEETGLGPAAVLILVVFALLGALAQMVALVIREGLLIVVVGLLPLAAASWSLSTGKQAFKSMVGFVVAALLFKPIATLLYLVAFWLSSGNEAPSVMEAVSSMLLLASAGLVLPALMRVVAPAVSQSVAGGSAAGIGAAAAGATGAVAGMAGAALGHAAQSLSASGGAQGAGGGSGGAANGAAYLGPHSSGGAAESGPSGASPSGGGGGPTGAPAGGGGGPAGAPAGGGASPAGAPAGGGGGSTGASGGVAGAMAGAARGAGAVAGLAASGAGGMGRAAQGAARVTQSTEQMLSGALAAHPTPDHYR
ncbi:hypothetical protein [Dietzia sp. DQ12-45-1b]|uniref:hypothetical protein n=1 Tax=Dietzia sp. DQ12-45-1b TaxID=912801 RepID=UPI0012E76146|nr:hypothetical protein [Dietzia sp. DQ12-45-1b]